MDLNKQRSEVIAIFFLKWDRFSPNTSDAYQLISILRKLGVDVKPDILKTMPLMIGISLLGYIEDEKAWIVENSVKLSTLLKQVDLVVTAREFLRNPYFETQAAKEPGQNFPFLFSIRGLICK